MEHNNISKPMVSTSPSKGKLLDSPPCVDSRRGVKPNVNCVICKLPGHKYEFCLKFGDFCVKCGYEGHVSEHCENVLTMFKDLRIADCKFCKHISTRHALFCKYQGKISYSKMIRPRNNMILDSLKPDFGNCRDRSCWVLKKHTKSSFCFQGT